MENLSEQWKKLRDGDHLTDEALEKMIKQIKDAEPFLLSYDCGAVRRAAYVDAANILSMISARRRDRQEKREKRHECVWGHKS